MSQSRSLLTATIQLLVLATVLLLISGPMPSVEAGKKEKLLMGLAVGHALSSRARDHSSLLRLMIPLRMATEAWKRFGEVTAHHGHHHGGFEGHHHHHGGHHFGHHLELEDHEFGHHHLFKA